MTGSKVANGEEVGAPVLYRLGEGVGTIVVKGQRIQSLQLPHPRQIWPRPKSTDKRVKGTYMRNEGDILAKERVMSIVWNRRRLQTYPIYLRRMSLLGGVYFVST